MNFRIRQARPEDAPFIARTILSVVGIDGEPASGLVEACRMDDTLYSWRHARLMEAISGPVGCVIAYEGSKYRPMREKTLKTAWNLPDAKVLEDEDECFAGEYYIDSLMIVPEFRGRGFGQLLVTDAIKGAKMRGCSAVTLLAARDCPSLASYYEGMGFVGGDEMIFLGRRYRRMRCDRK